MVPNFLGYPVQVIQGKTFYPEKILIISGGLKVIKLDGLPFNRPPGICRVSQRSSDSSSFVFISIGTGNFKMTFYNSTVNSNTRVT